MSEVAILRQKIQFVKNILSFFSNTLKYDFLFILLRMVSAELRIPTKRNDWRTRDGIFQFFARHWNESYNVMGSKPAIRWFCTHFKLLENLLVNKSFSLFLYDNWNDYGPYFSNHDFIQFIKTHTTLILTCLHDPQSLVDLCEEGKFGIQFAEILDNFHNGKKSTMVPVWAKKNIDVTMIAPSTPPEPIKVDTPPYYQPAPTPLVAPVTQPQPAPSAIPPPVECSQTITFDPMFVEPDFFEYDPVPVDDLEYLF